MFPDAEHNYFVMVLRTLGFGKPESQGNPRHLRTMFVVTVQLIDFKFKLLRIL